MHARFCYLHSVININYKTKFNYFKLLEMNTFTEKGLVFHINKAIVHFHANRFWFRIEFMHSLELITMLEIISS